MLSRVSSEYKLKTLKKGFPIPTRGVCASDLHVCLSNKLFFRRLISKSYKNTIRNETSVAEKFSILTAFFNLCLNIHQEW